MYIEYFAVVYNFWLNDKIDWMNGLLRRIGNISHITAIEQAVRYTLHS